MIPTRYRPAVAIAAILTVNALIWAVALSQFPGPLPLRNILAEYLSTSALLIAGTNLLLVTRARPLESTFGGLDKLFTAHRLNGLAVALLVVGHFLLVPRKFPLAPSGLVGFAALALLVSAVLVAIAPRAPWRRLVWMRYDHWKLGHRTMGLIVALAATHSVLVTTKLSRALPAVTLWVYGFTLLGLVAYAFRETLEPALLQRHRYKVAESTHPAPDVVEIVLEPMAHPIAHRAGQFAFVRFQDGPSLEQHPFTISAPPQGGPLRFTIKSSGDYTAALQTHLPSGSEARIEGPYGRFDYARAGTRQLWLAGGVGITPFLAFLPTLADDGRRVDLVWTVRSAAEAVHRDEIERTASDTPGLAVTIHETATMGRLHMADLDIPEPAGLDVLICGPVPMRKAFVIELLALGVSRDRIFYEEFSLR